jgi:hypothetical protein|tara:strand:- start:1386 stop:2066 length:681 start_codon:yes stop_codon:yes gene_type:complete
MKKLFIFMVLSILLSLTIVSAGITSINYPYDNDIITHSLNIPLDVSSSASTNCVLYYDSSTGAVPYNQSVGCSGITEIDLPNANGVYNLTISDDAGSTKKIKITLEKPEGILITAIYILTFAILLGMLFIFIITLAKISVVDLNVYNVAVSLTFYFALLISYQLNQEYANVPFILDWLDLLIKMGGYLLVVVPLVGFVITLIIKSTKKGDVVDTRDLTGGKLMRYG